MATEYALDSSLTGAFSSASPEMHGRRQIFTNETEITRENVLDVLNKALTVHLLNREEIIYLDKYMRGIQPVLQRYKKYNADVNNKIVVNIANEIVTFKTSEFAGEPIQYVSRGSRSREKAGDVGKINDMMLSEGKQTKDLQLTHQMFTCGVGYRLAIHDQGRKGDEYLDEAPFEMYIPEPKNTFVVRCNDVSKRVVMGVTYVFNDDKGTAAEYTVYTPNVTYVIKGSSGSGEEIIRETRHNFGLVSLVEYPCNPSYMGAFEPVLPLMDAINLTQSNRLDGIEQFIQALMVLDGVDATEEQLAAMKDKGAVKLPPAMSGGGGKRIYYLNEQLDQTQTQTLVNDMYQTILEIVGMPSQGDASTGDSSNNGAVIMKNGWWHAEARALETQSMWKQAETDFLKIVLKICSDTNTLSGLRISDMEPKFWRQSYEDLLVKTQSFSTLRSSGMPAIQCFTFSHLSRDPEGDAIVYDDYQQALAEELDRLNNAEEQPVEENEDGTFEGTVDETLDPTDKENRQAAANAEEGGSSEGGSIAICPVCGKRFRRKESGQRYDSIACANRGRRTTPRYYAISGK